MNKLQWNLDWNSNILIQENAFESVVCETAAILSRPQCVTTLRPEDIYSSVTCVIIGTFNGATRPLPEPMLVCCQLDYWLHTSVKCELKHILSFSKMHLKIQTTKHRLFCLGLNVSKGFWRLSFSRSSLLQKYVAQSDDTISICICPDESIYSKSDMRKPAMVDDMLMRIRLPWYSYRAHNTYLNEWNHIWEKRKTVTTIGIDTRHMPKHLGDTKAPRSKPYLTLYVAYRAVSKSINFLRHLRQTYINIRGHFY